MLENIDGMTIDNKTILEELFCLLYVFFFFTTLCPLNSTSYT